MTTRRKRHCLLSPFTLNLEIQGLPCTCWVSGALGIWETGGSGVFKAGCGVQVTLLLGFNSDLLGIYLEKKTTSEKSEVAGVNSV